MNRPVFFSRVLFFSAFFLAAVSISGCGPSDRAKPSSEEKRLQETKLEVEKRRQQVYEQKAQELKEQELELKKETLALQREALKFQQENIQRAVGMQQKNMEALSQHQKQQQKMMERMERRIPDGPR